MKPKRQAYHVYFIAQRKVGTGYFRKRSSLHCPRLYETQDDIENGNDSVTAGSTDSHM